MASPGAIPALGALLLGAVLWSCGRNRQDGARPGSTSPADRTTRQPAATPPEASASPTESARTPNAAPRQIAFNERVADRTSLSQQLAEDGIADAEVLRAIRTVPRHAFVPLVLEPLAYFDRALPIVGGQTISQPFIVAFMTEAAKPTKDSVCLEVGTGSGYQAAVLAELCKHTYSIEYLPDVARFGEKNLRELGYGPDRVSLRVGDGYAGWPETAPFDVILVTAAPEHVPEPLLAQLAVHGRLVIPVGASNDVQELQRWTRLRPGNDKDAFRVEMLLPVRFVPFAGERTAHE